MFKNDYPSWLLNLDSMLAEYVIEIIILIVYVVMDPEIAYNKDLWLYGLLTGFTFYSGK